jgi:hypothetical protein
MVALPVDTPVTSPLVASTEATAVLLLLHVPPVLALLSVVTTPVQTPVRPVIAGGLTVMIAVAGQPEETEYEMVTEPDARPVTVPVAEPTMATAGLLLLHVPPEVASDNVTEAPRQTVPEPDTGAVPAFTVTVAVVIPPATV